MNIEDLTLKQIREIRSMIGDGFEPQTETLLKSVKLYEIGKSYFIRTVTFSYTGRLIDISDHELVFDNAAWIADTGRFADAMRTGEFNEVEPYPDGMTVHISRGAVVDCSDWPHPLPRNQR